MADPRRRLLRTYLARQRGAVTAMAVLLLGGIGLQLLEPQVIGRVIESVQRGTSQRSLIELAGLYFVVSMLRRAVTVLAALASERVAWQATNAVRADLTAHVLHQDPQFHADHSAGELIERIDGDVDEIADFFSTFVIQFLGNALLAVGIVIAVVVLNPLVGGFFAVAVGVGIVALQWIGRGAQVHWEANREHSARYFGLLSESLQGTEDIRSSNAVAHVLGKLSARARAWEPVTLRSAVWGTSIWLIATAVLTVVSVLAYAFGGELFRRGSISLAEVYLLVAYAGMLANPMETIQDQTSYLQRASAAIARVSRLFATRSSIVDGVEVMRPGPAAVEFDAVSFSYGNGFGLRGLSFRVEAGRTLGIVGRTGAGKSTIAHLLFRLYDPDDGRILVADTDIRRLRIASLRSRIGFVTQDVQLFDATVRDNLTFFADRSSDDLLDEVLAAVGLELDLDARIVGDSLSAGQAQLLAFARVLLEDPAVVVLDEPSSRLDPATEARLQQAMQRLLAGRTAIVIAHRLETIRRSDQVIVLDSGRILEQGAPDDLLRRDESRFAELFRTGEVLA